MKRPRILDGGLATSLEARGHLLHARLWSAGLFLDRPQAILDVHRSFVDAGAEILVGASYQMSFEGLSREGLDRNAAADALRRTVTVAREAADAAPRPVRVAASVGPYGAALADGSEYRGNYGLGVSELKSFHRERLDVLASSGADLLAVETLPSLDEARAVVELLDERDGIPAWVSFSCRDGQSLRDGTPMADAARLLDACGRIDAVGVNCTDPQHVSSLIDEIRGGTGKRVVVYPNSGETWDAVRRNWTGEFDRAHFLERAREWAARDVWAIGGCCRIGPAEIRELADALGG